jgi:hypothetical protein
MIAPPYLESSHRGKSKVRMWRSGRASIHYNTVLGFQDYQPAANKASNHPLLPSSLRRLYSRSVSPLSKSLSQPWRTRWKSLQTTPITITTMSNRCKRHHPRPPTTPRCFPTCAHPARGWWPNLAARERRDSRRGGRNSTAPVTHF